MIRDARPADHDAIVAAVDAAFGGKEKALRIVREVEPEVSLVWDEGGRVVGHVMLRRMRMGELRVPSPLRVMTPSGPRRTLGRWTRRFACSSGAA